MVLCSGAIHRLRNGESKLLENIEILLEPTIFGTVVSGKIPESLRNKTEQVCSYMTTPRTVTPLHEHHPTEGEDEELNQILEAAGTQIPTDDQLQQDTITVEIHQEKEKEDECSWADEAVLNNW